MSDEPTKEEQDLLWRMIKTLSAQIDEWTEGSIRPEHEILLGPALLMSSIRKIRKSGASYDEAFEFVNKTFRRLKAEHEEKRNQLRIVKTDE